MKLTVPPGRVKKVLWLTSWYPGPPDPVLGDFIQRHAEAVAEFVPVDLVYVVQQGPQVFQKEEVVLKNKRGNLAETILIFPFKPAGFSLIDKIRYQLTYLNYTQKIVEGHIKTVGRPDLIHVHIPIKAGLVARRLSKKYGIPFIVSDHSSHYEKEAEDSFYNRSYFFRNNTRKVLKDAVAVTNVSSAAANIMQRLFRLQNVRTIHNVVDQRHFFYRERAARSRDRFRFLHVSSLSSQKNFPAILEALDLLNGKTRNWEMVVCGPQPERFSQEVENRGLQSQLRFDGEVAYSAVAAEMQKADALVLFSLHENFPCVVIEALCCGLPVISSKAGGVAEAIDRSNGILVEKNDVEALSDAMREMMENYDGYNSKSISEQALKKYNYRQIGKEFLELYEWVLKRT